jgi:hypothetical protein
MNLRDSLRRHWRRRRLAALAEIHGTRALRAHHRGDPATFAEEVNTLARHGNAAVYLAVVGWCIQVRRATTGSPAAAVNWQLRVAVGDDDTGVQLLDDPDSLQVPAHRAGVWASRMLTCVLNGDEHTAAALFVASATEGNPHLTLAIDAAADMTIALIADTPHGRRLLGHR